MKIVLLSLYNHDSYAVRGFHALLQSKCDVSSLFFKTSTYTDNPTHGFEIDALIDSIRSKNPDVLAVSVHSPVFQIFKRISNKAREFCKVMVGGEHATACPEDCVDYADYVISGEGENALLDLVGGRLKDGITFSRPLENLDDIEFPFYSPYEDISTNGAFSYVASRGCPFRCSYCTESIRCEPIRRKSVDKVIEELKRVRDAFKIYRIIFSDSIFTLNTKWLEYFCEKFAPLDMKFMCYGHPVGVTDRIIKMMKSAGLYSFRMGVQSGSESVRRIYNRKENLDQILEAAFVLYNNGVPSGYDFIVNSPYDDDTALRCTRDFIDRLPEYSGINCFELRWFPKTPLTEKALKEGKILEKDIEGNYNRFGGWNYSYMKGII